MKKFAIAFLCLACVLLPVGCSQKAPQADPYSIVMQSQIGRELISQNFAFPANCKDFEKLGFDKQTIAAYSDSLCKEIANKVRNVIFLNYFAVYASSPNNDYLFGGKNAIAEEAKYNPETDKIEFSFIFTYPGWTYYHPSSKEDEKENGEGIFLDVTKSNAQFPFSQKKEEQSIGEYYVSIAQQAQEQYFSNSIPAQKTTFEYDYATFHKRIHSNADLTYADSLYHHVWKSDRQGLNEEKQVTLKTVNANRGWWYLVVFGSAIVAAGTACLIIFLKDRKKKVIKREQE